MDFTSAPAFADPATGSTLRAGRSTVRRAILRAGLVAGVLDITAACVQVRVVNGAGPLWLLQSVASALLGRERAFGGGAATAALGLLMHFTVAFAWAAVFVALAARRPWLVRRPGVVGPLYGLAVFTAMNCGALPFLSWMRSLYLHTPVVFPGPMGAVQAAIHVVCVGLPIVFVVRQSLR